MPHSAADREKKLRTDVWLTAQKEAFQVAMNGGALEASLGVLVRAVIAQSEDECRCAFYIAGAAGTQHHVVGMSETHPAQMDGFVSSLDGLSCGLPLARGGRVITSDILEDPLWKDWTWLAREQGYRACWSFPVETAAGKLVGGFALFFAEPRELKPIYEELAAAMTQSAGIIIAHHQAQAVLRDSDARQRILVAELQHRTRNIIAIVQSLSNQTAAGDIGEFRRIFGDRLAALSRAQSLLSRAEPITIGALLAMELHALGDEILLRRIQAAGPEIVLHHDVIQTLALAMHELATNALKYGALAHETGRIAISWQLAKDEPRLRLEWRESGLDLSSAQMAPDHRGYGRELIEQALPYSLGARTSFHLGRSGACCTIDLPLTAHAANMQETPAPLPAGAVNAAAGSRKDRPDASDRTG